MHQSIIWKRPLWPSYSWTFCRSPVSIIEALFHRLLWLVNTMNHQSISYAYCCLISFYHFIVLTRTLWASYMSCIWTFCQLIFGWRRIINQFLSSRRATAVFHISSCLHSPDPVDKVIHLRPSKAWPLVFRNWRRGCVWSLGRLTHMYVLSAHPGDRCERPSN